ncbi:hypothetical protein [Gorillibacterium sp. sgz5001074]|uniref:hypothetical protein n=1 Tax=Gorillibacterium sp. sgz5001074 TaxID=3446695 RepID=UPI003F673FD4
MLKKKTVKASPKKILRKRHLTAKAKITQNLGNGFRRDVYQTFTIFPGDYVRIDLPVGPNRRVITGGWSITDDVEVYATDYYPSTPRRWTIFLHNQGSISTTVTTYLISKRRFS